MKNKKKETPELYDLMQYKIEILNTKGELILEEEPMLPVLGGRVREDIFDEFNEAFDEFLTQFAWSMLNKHYAQVIPALREYNKGQFYLENHPEQSMTIFLTEMILDYFTDSH